MGIFVQGCKLENQKTASPGMFRVIVHASSGFITGGVKRGKVPAQEEGGENQDYVEFQDIDTALAFVKKVKAQINSAFDLEVYNDRGVLCYWSQCARPMTLGVGI